LGSACERSSPILYSSTNTSFPSSCSTCRRQYKEADKGMLYCSPAARTQASQAPAGSVRRAAAECRQVRGSQRVLCHTSVDLQLLQLQAGGSTRRQLKACCTAVLQHKHKLLELLQLQEGIQVGCLCRQASTGKHGQGHQAKGASGAAGGDQQLPTDSRQPAAHLPRSHPAPLLSPPTCVLCLSSSMRRSLSAMASSRPATSRCSPSMVPCSCCRSASALLRRRAGGRSGDSWVEQEEYCRRANLPAEPAGPCPRPQTTRPQCSNALPHRSCPLLSSIAFCCSSNRFLSSPFSPLSCRLASPSTCSCLRYLQGRAHAGCQMCAGMNGSAHSRATICHQQCAV
jgi:hypothetical protein